MNKGDIVRVEITDMTDDGRGVGHFRGMTVFVSGAVYGDIVDAEITKVKKRFSEAEASKLVSVSPYRINSPNSVYHIEFADSEGGEANETGENKICRYVDECGGCAYGKLTRECENELKERHVREKLSRIGGVENPNVLPIVDPSASAPTNPTASATTNPTASRQNYTGLNYRNKAVMAVGLSEEGKPLIGFRPRKSHKVIDCDNCMIQMPPAMAVANRVREYIE